MKRALSFLPILLLASCYPTRIVTVTPYSGSAETYSTTVSVPRTNTVTTTTQVYASSYDISLDLDLQAVAAAFGQASNVREFEYLLNDSSYIISNLDLNRDGFVDYLRVVETLDGYNHLFVIQAVLSDNVFQDVATVVVENPHLGSFHVEIIGAPFIYGPSFFIRPVFHTKPCIFAHLCIRDYRPWMSPWYWNHYPSCYHRPQPVYLSHYQAYVATYMSNSRYCHRVEYPSVCHYSRYDDMTRGLQRNDYGARHPERSFTTRTANNPEPGTSALERIRQASSAKPYNAQDIREAQATRSTSTSTTRSQSSSTARSQSSAGRTGSGSQTRSGSGSSTGRSGSYSESQSRGGSGTATGRTEAGSQTRSGNSSSTGRSGAATGTTTVNSRVNNSGSSNTSTRTVSPSGTSTTVRRGSSSATRSSGSEPSTNNSRSGSAGVTRSGAAASSGSSRSGAATSSRSTRSGSTASSSGSSSRSSTSSSSRTSGGSGSARR